MFVLWRPTFTIVGLVFLIAGIGMAIFVGAYVVGDYEKILNGERAEAVVLQASDGGKPILEFRTRQGQRVRVEGKISTSPSAYKVGERIGVFYDPADPSDALIDSFIERWFVALLFGGFGTVFIVVGGTLFAIARRSGRRLARLLREGRRFEGRVAAFEMNQFTKINGRRPWHVLVDWTDAQGQPRRERSAMLREDPAKRFKIGDTVAVLADPANPKLFWIDLDGRSKNVQTGFGGTSGNVSTGLNVGGMGKSGTNPVVRRR
jgi:hypothetical protein